MQSDAFPTPPIYVHHFQPRLVDLESEPPKEGDRLEHLLDQIEMLISDCSTEESQSFWLATDCIKLKHRVIESMQKVESLFIDLAKASTQNPAMLSAVSENLLYTGTQSIDSQNVPNFLKQRLC